MVWSNKHQLLHFKIFRILKVCRHLMLATKANLLSIAIENTLRQKILRRGPRS